MYHDLVIRKPELVAQAVQVVIGLFETGQRSGEMRQAVPLPRYETTTGTAADGKTRSEKENRFAQVLLHL